MKFAAQIEQALQRPLSRIGLGWRLALAVVVLLAPLCALGGWYVYSKSQAIRAAQFERISVAYLEPLGDLIGKLADERGLIILRLMDAASEPLSTGRVGSEINRLLEQAEAAERTMRGAPGDEGKLVAIRSRIAALRSDAGKLPPAEVYSRYTALIHEVIDLSDSVVEASSIATTRAERFHLIAALFGHGVDFRHAIADLRDTLTPLAHRGTPRDTARIAVATHIAAIVGLNHEIRRSFTNAYRELPRLRAELEPLVLTNEAKVYQLVADAERMLSGESPFTAAQAFAASTDLLNHYDMLDDAAGASLTRLLDEHIAQLTQAQFVAMALVSVAICLALLIAILSVRSVTAPIARLIGVVDRLARGEKDSRSKLETPDEIGVLGRELDKLMDERKRSEEQLTFLAQYDTLTELPNRHMFRDALVQMLRLAAVSSARAACMFVDLDRFKYVNDTFGHSAGDKLLIEVAERLQRCVRSGDIVARLAGDEFAVALANIGRPENAGVVAQKVIAALAAPFDLDGHATHISASVGIAVFPDNATEGDELLKMADMAMYRAKERGRNNYQHYLPEMNEHALRRLQLETSLRGALERSEFLLHYQPKADLAEGAISGFEALLRWQSAERGLVSPAEFIPALEESGEIVTVGEWVLETALAQISAWQAEGLRPAAIAINLSARQFEQKHLARFVARIRESRLDASLIQLELTESLLMQDSEAAIRALGSLKGAGVRLSIDDFGTGYSSLAYLKRFPLDEIKIDRAFIRDVTTDPEDAEITLAIISLAHSLGLKVVAEGVETELQLRFLRAHGCDEIQGYYFARPALAAQCTAMIRQGRRLELPAAEDAAGETPTVLVVDDTATDLELMRRALQPAGYRVFEAASCEAAFEVLTRHRVDMVISDHGMPGMSGVEFLAKVRKLYPAALRVVMSGHGSATAVTDAVNDAGIHKYLSKNWNSARVRAEVREAFLATDAGLREGTKARTASAK